MRVRNWVSGSRQPNNHLGEPTWRPPHAVHLLLVMDLMGFLGPRAADSGEAASHSEMIRPPFQDDLARGSGAFAGRLVPPPLLKPASRPGFSRGRINSVKPDPCRRSLAAARPPFNGRNLGEGRSGNRTFVFWHRKPSKELACELRKRIVARAHDHNAIARTG